MDNIQYCTVVWLHILFPELISVIPSYGTKKYDEHRTLDASIHHIARYNAQLTVSRPQGFRIKAHWKPFETSADSRAFFSNYCCTSHLTGSRFDYFDASFRALFLRSSQIVIHHRTNISEWPSGQGTHLPLNYPTSFRLRDYFHYLELLGIIEDIEIKSQLTTLYLCSSYAVLFTLRHDLLPSTSLFPLAFFTLFVIPSPFVLSFLSLVELASFISLQIPIYLPITS
jgi:hypothetical protein